jgi:hypothetical protein
MNPLCAPLNIILQEFTTATKLHHYFTAQTHDNIRTGRQASGIFCSIRRTEISCDSRQLYESKWTRHSFFTGIPKKMYETRTDEWHTASINPRVSSLGVDTSEIFTQWFLHFIKHTKPTEKKILLSRYWTGTIHTQRNWR